jgi:chaperonin GroEL (HSP60 family)
LKKLNEISIKFDEIKKEEELLKKISKTSMNSKIISKESEHFCKICVNSINRINKEINFIKIIGKLIINNK